MNITIIRTNGTEEQITVDRTSVMKKIHEVLGAKYLDTVNLRDGRVMFVDDGGYETREEQVGENHIKMVPVRALKPVNARATRLYHSVCVPGTTHQIVGDVVIVIDEDFA
jgi:hypothetical protein